MRRLGVFCKHVLDRHDEEPLIAHDNSKFDWAASSSSNSSTKAFLAKAVRVKSETG